ncbi:MAG: hypothetical protein N3A53_08715 [Verrucomicrobiae bacterium]|nr:hypothetical protein [Verrucomicrobiae bacterium]
MTIRKAYRIRTQIPIAELERSRREEIAKYKWIESEKRGYDIGWERAQAEWMEKHFADWKRARWLSAVQEALQRGSGLN